MGSNTAIKQFNYTLIRHLLKHEDLISITSRQRKIDNMKTMNQTLQNAGYVLRNIRSLKAKHIVVLVEDWKKRGLGIGRMKNLLSDLRFIAKSLHKSSIVKSNEEYNIGQRIYHSQTNKAIHNPDFSKVEDNSLLISLNLQRVFGLRREECLKIKPHIADEDICLRLLPSWTKGGVGRIVPIKTDEQRYWLDQAKKLVSKKDSMIPNDKTYRQYSKYYNNETKKIGLERLHGLRHAYAQRRYEKITGWKSPINCGKQKKYLSDSEKRLDYQARIVISRELGHSRVEITRTYIG